MKRYGNLWEKVISWENLVLAARKARRGKRSRLSVQTFEFGLEKQLLQLQRELQQQTYEPGQFHTHWIYEPKKRLISAAPYSDRVVHHALMNVLEPILDRHFHPDSFACRKEKGTHKAANRLQSSMKRYGYVLQCDIQKFFPSIDHNALKSMFRRLIKDKRVLWLMDLIVDSSNDQPRQLCWFDGDDLFTPLRRRRGLPIGNLTSQWFANWYLNGLDHYITSHLGIGRYIRYCDDFILLGNDKEQLKDAAGQIERYLASVRLRLHRNTLFIRPAKAGMTFVGYRIWPTHRLLKKQNIRNLRRRIRWMKDAYSRGILEWKDVKLRLDSWLGHAKHADTRILVKRLSREWKFRRDRAVNRLCSSRRQLEQQRQQLPCGKPQQQQPEQPEQQQRVSSFPALSRESCDSARNRAIYGLCERGIESPGSVPELRFSKLYYRSRIYAARPGGSGRCLAESPIRPFLLKCRGAS
jgi:retron-type reverse transcriptase